MKAKLLFLLSMGSAVLFSLASFSSPSTTNDSNDVKPAQTLQIKQNEFYLGGKRFVPRGANYTRLGSNGYHITFSQYDRVRAENALRQLSHDGYNVVRVFLEPEFIAQRNTPRLDYGYMDKLFDFIRMAKNLNIFVVLAKDIWLPQSYLNAYTSSELSSEFGNAGPVTEFNINQFILDPSFIFAAEAFLGDVAKAIALSDVSSSVISFDVYQEAHYRAEFYPFSKTQGIYRPYTGISYEMSQSSDRQQLADALAVEFANRLSRAIKLQKSDALVAISLFTPLDIGQPTYNGMWPSPGRDNRRPFRHRSLEIYSQLDYSSVHLYSADGTTRHLENALTSIEISKNQSHSKPLVIDEIGLFQSKYSSLVNAANAARSQIDLLCDYRVTGWLFWTLDTFEQAGFIHLLSGSGEVNGLLAPIAHFDTKCGL